MNAKLEMTPEEMKKTRRKIENGILRLNECINPNEVLWLLEEVERLVLGNTLLEQTVEGQKITYVASKKYWEAQHKVLREMMVEIFDSCEIAGKRKHRGDWYLYLANHIADKAAEALKEVG